MVRDVADAAGVGIDKKGRGDGLGFAGLTGLRVSPDGMLLNHDSALSAEDTAGIEGDPGAGQPVDHDCSAGAGTAWTEQLDVLVKHGGEPSSIPGIDRVVPGRDNGDRVAHASTEPATATK